MMNLAIIGANGYVGSRLTSALAHTYNVTAIRRGIDSLSRLVSGVKYKTVSEDLPIFDVVINTAYTLDKNHANCASANNEMIKLLNRICNKQTKIIHLSSLAVFGFALDKELKADAIATRNDYTYVFSKLDMENKLIKHFGNKRVSIIRLGNVWGPGNTSYTQPVIDSLLWELPLLPDKPGMCNLTHIDNIVSYITHSISCTQHLTFHHLAEWSGITWKQVIDDMAKIMGVKPVSLMKQAYYPLSFRDEVLYAFGKKTLEAIKTLRSGRFTSAYFPERLFNKVLLKHAPMRYPKQPQLGNYAIPDTFIWILNCKQSFTNVWLANWQPLLSWEQSLKPLTYWMKESGYCIKEQNS
jgi:nucleoside-diphosphate-sugar epimerase